MIQKDANETSPLRGGEFELSVPGEVEIQSSYLILHHNHFNNYI